MVYEGNILLLADPILIKTRMTTFIKTKFQKSEYQTNIDKYNRISYYIKINLPKNPHSIIHDEKAFISYKNAC